MVDAGDHVEQGGFAAAGFADNGDKFPFAQHQVQSLQHGELAGGILEGLDHLLQLDHGLAPEHARRFTPASVSPG